MNKTCTCGWVSILSVLLGVLISTSVVGQEDCDGYRYRYTGSFDAFDVDYGVIYGENVVNGTLVDWTWMSTPCGRFMGQSSTHRHCAWWVFSERQQRQPRRGSALRRPRFNGLRGGAMNCRLLPVDLALEAALSGTLTTEFVKAVWRVCMTAVRL